jgi:hypothetical protein
LPVVIATDMVLFFRGDCMKLELKRMSVWAAVKVSFVLNLIFGFLYGILYSMILLVISSLPIAAMGDEAPGALSAFAGIAAIFLPFIVAICFAVFGTIFVAISVVLYNLIAKLTGGYILEFDQVVEVVPVSAPVGFSPPAGGEQQSTL